VWCAHRELSPRGFKTGDQISPPGGYVGGGLQMQVDVDISPSGDVWVTNNWQDIDSCYKNAADALSTRCGGQGVTVVLWNGQAGARAANRSGATSKLVVNFAAAHFGR
jgi:hypothetical protein